MSKSVVKWSLGFLLLMQTGPAVVSGQTDQEEEAFWQSVECENAPQVQEYLETYPNGVHLIEALVCLEGPLGLDQAARILAQRGLAALDYAPGPMDGLFGPRTRQALREWQAGEGVTATGYLTREQADTLIAQGQEETPEASFQISPDQTCARRPEGAGCWMELANQAGCHVWNDNLKEDETMMWTGECSNGLAQGKGVLTSSHDEGSVATSTGLLQSGKRHDHWVERKEGDVYEGPFVDGKRQGHWALRYADGDVYEGPVVGGQPHGLWTLRYADGDVSEVTYENGEPQDQ